MATTNGISQMVQNGQIVDTTASGNSQSSTSKAKNSSLDKEAFLQLLVAQMKYQDPLQPTSNTEYISQLATFSSLEEMQNMNKTMTDMQGTELVGKQVVMKVTSNVSGETSYVSGMVDYIQRENGKTFLVIEGNPYNIEDLDSVVDEKYLGAVSLAESFKETVAKLPDVKYVTLADKEGIEAVKSAVNAMSAYEQGFLDSNSLNKLKDLVAKIAELEKNVEKPEEKPEETEKDETADNSGGEKNE